jgi:hypothetical protein
MEHSDSTLQKQMTTSLELHDSKNDTVPPMPPMQGFCCAFVIADYTLFLGGPQAPLAWYPGADSLWRVCNVGTVPWQPGRSFLASCGAPKGDFWFLIAASEPPVQPGQQAVVGVIFTSEASPAIPAPPAQAVQETKAEGGIQIVAKPVADE